MDNSLPAKEAGTGRGRSAGLDFVRGVAILLVLFHHPAVAANEAGGLRPLAATLERFGWTGVDLFFVLSGFLVGGLLFQELQRSGGVDVLRFLLRRGLKIWPSYYAFLCVGTVQLLRHAQEPVGVSLRRVVPNLLHAQNYLGTPFGITWTLAVEEHFYLILPIVLLGVARMAKRPLPQTRAMEWLAAGMLAACLALRCAENLHRPYALLSHVAYTHLRIDSLFWGVFLSYLFYCHPRRLETFAKHRAAWAAVGLMLVSPMAFLPLKSPLVWTAGFTLLAAGYGVLCLTMARGAEDSPRLRRFLGGRVGRMVAWMGVYSYSIYLWHINIALYLVAGRMAHAPFAGMPGAARWVVGMACYGAAAAGAGWLMATLIEMPMLRLRNRLLPSKAA